MASGKLGTWSLRAQQAEISGSVDSSCTVTALIETGNFIAQIPDGNARRKTAQTFEELLRLVIKNQAPWRLHQFIWGTELLEISLLAAAQEFRSLIMR